MSLDTVLAAVPYLSDLELAVLLGLIAKQPILVRGKDDVLGTLASELALISSDIFGLSYVVLEKFDYYSVDSFGDAILDEDHCADADQSDSDSDNDASGALRSQIQGVSFKATREPAGQSLDNRMVVNVIIAKDFNLACHDVQIQVMELVRRRRIYSKTTVHTAPKTFLFIPLVSTSSSHLRLNHHLNDRIFISHTHNVADGFPNVEDLETVDGNGKQLLFRSSTDRLHISRDALDQLHKIGQETTITPEVRRYLQNLVVFLRVERGVEGGISPYSNVCFVDLAKYLAPLHGINFVTPSLIELAAKKVFPHRLTIARPDQERSTQFGSNVEIIKQYVEGLSPELIIDNVIAKVPVPM
jgi:hypothetical protein